jgi:exodeoxyribonuclease V alpha subunit
MPLGDEQRDLFTEDPAVAESLDVIEGIADHLKLVRPDGYTVACIAVTEDKNVIATGHLLVGVMPGETLRLSGHWKRHPKHGRGFAVEACERILPAEVYAIRRYLASGLIRGIGVKLAHAIVSHFAERTLTVIDDEPERLLEVHNIGPDRMRKILFAWQEQKTIREVMIFLQGVGVSPALAVQIHKEFEDQAMKIVREQPYRLIEKVRGINFLTADKIALKVGIPEHSPERMAAGLQHVLDQARMMKGHCYVPERVLLSGAADLLGADIPHLQPVLGRLRADRTVVAEASPRDGSQETVIFPGWLHNREVTLTRELTRLHTAASRMPGEARWLSQGITSALTGRRSPDLHPDQERAVLMALTNTVSILTGGPGCGKTFAVRLIAQLARQAGATVALAAPTGRAAKRLSDLTGMPAMTVHRMIRPRSDPSAEGALFDHDDLAQADLIVVDETSMLDLRLACELTEKIASGAHLLFVGDPYQLPSIGAGNVLYDLLEVPGIPRVALTRIFRQAQGSTIITNAHLVRRGQMPRIHGHFYHFSKEDPEGIADLVTDIATRQIPERFGVDTNDIQVLCPTTKGAPGAMELNRRLQDRLNPASADPCEHWAEGRVFRPGDKVMPIRNRYDKGTAGVFNGSSATITRLIQDEQRIEILTDDGETISYDHDELDELLHAYAITVHRSQGSQYPWVVIPLSTAAGALMLQRSLLYTAITRAEHAIVIVGQRSALELAVERTGARRNTALTRRLNDRLIHTP